MSIEIKVPTLPESVTDATVSKWYKAAGEVINRDDNLVDLETDKVMLEVPAPQGGVIEKILIEEGAIVNEGTVLAILKEGAVAEVAASAASTIDITASAANAAAGSAVAPPPPIQQEELSPSVRRAAAEKGVDAAQLSGSGKDGRVTKQDVLSAGSESATAVKAPAAAIPAMGAREEKRVPMSRLRQRVAERLLQVQEESALLTTFNEINMKPIMDLRKKYKDQFEKEHGVRLGFMSLFTKATVEALKRLPVVNASIDGNDIMYHNYYDIGIAVGSPRGLVVPVVRDADTLSLAGIEAQIKEYAVKAQTGKLTIEEMTGGTFTITNGGVFGSMLSTPIINAPQSAILGMHNIVERPVAENGEVVIRPVMYVALSYDHRIIDGRESVTFLKTIKELIEDPARMLLQV